VARYRSARDVLRVGVTSLTTVNGSLVHPATIWSNAHRTVDGVRSPTLVDQSPSISNDALRFVAGGAFEVVWHLRPGLRWSDGTALTSTDLVFAEQLAPDPHTIGTTAADLETMVVRYDDRVARVIDDFTPVPHHALDAIYRHGGYEAVHAYRNGHPLPGTGPYRVVDFVPNDHETLDANPFFVGSRPSIPHITIEHYADADAAYHAFEAGEIDLVWSNVGSPEQARAFAARQPGATHIQPADLLIFLNPDLDVPLFANLDVRRALLMAINRDRIRNEVFGEGARPAYIPVPGDPPAGSVATPYDPDRARTMLATANATGARIPLLINASSPTDHEVSQRIAEDLRAVGLVVDVHDVPNTAELYRGRHHGGLLLYAINAGRDDSPRRYWSIPLVNGNYSRTARNAAFDDDTAALADREERALYPERREQLRDRLFARFAERLPGLPLLFGIERVVVAPSLHGWEHGPSGRLGDGVEDWYFDAPSPSPAPPSPTGPAPPADGGAIDAAAIDGAAAASQSSRAQRGRHHHGH
jgi:ABC-type transport system substrate-binding protein